MLPKDILFSIFIATDMGTLKNCMTVNKSFNAIINSDIFWTTKFHKIHGVCMEEYKFWICYGILYDNNRSIKENFMLFHIFDRLRAILVQIPDAIRSKQHNYQKIEI